jgi:hypothetical protein
MLHDPFDPVGLHQVELFFGIHILSAEIFQAGYRRYSCQKARAMAPSPVLFTAHPAPVKQWALNDRMG